MIVGTIWSSTWNLSNHVFLSFPTKRGTKVNRLICWVIYLLENSNFHGKDGMIGRIKLSVKLLITSIINLRSVPVQSLPHFSLGCSHIYQPILIINIYLNLRKV